MIIDGNNLYPSEGFRYITNGENWSTWVILGKNDRAENWHDTNEEKPEPTPVDPELEELADVVNDAYNMADELIGG